MAVTSQTISLSQARRIALAAQGFADKRPTGKINRGHFSRMLERVGLLQIDSVNVLARSHYLPGFARLGAYAPELLEKEAWGRRPRLFEYWGHEASLLPLELQPFFRWRMEDAALGKATYSGLARFARENRAFIADMRREIEQRGPMGAGKLEQGGKGEGGWWGWSPGKMALEWLFWAGEITTKTRVNFERIYDLTERVIPSEVLRLPTPARADALRYLLQRSAEAMGIATLAELRDYYRLPVAGLKTHVAELVEAGVLQPVSLQNSRIPAFLHRDARLPRKVEAQALLSPFDNLVWERDRTERLFGFRYRLEIYTPAAKRQHGYYVLPFLLGDQLVARLCLKSDRATNTLKVNASHLEREQQADEVAAALASELSLMASWLGLEKVSVAAQGTLAKTLRAALRHL